jgi:hypothetical protein
MCKIVYLTSRAFDTPSNNFKLSLAKELRKRKVEVVTDTTSTISRFFRRHKVYGIAIAIDFFRDNKNGSGLTLNRRCSYISRDFAYNISNAFDVITPRIHWRDFKFVDSSDDEWTRFFHKISSETKAIFYLCTYNNQSDYDIYLSSFDKIIAAFADEIVRCLRSNYDYRDYQKRVKLSKLRVRR